MFEGLEKRINNRGGITYWKDGVLVGRKCTKCGKDKNINEFKCTNKVKGTYRGECKECESKCNKQWEEANKEYRKQYRKQYHENNKEYEKEYGRRYRGNNKGKIREREKQYYINNIEHIKERKRLWRENNKEHLKEKYKQWYENNKEHRKQYYIDNIEHLKTKKKLSYKNNISELTKTLEKVNPILKGLKAYGSIYKITNIKTGRMYIGQTTNSLNRRYGSNIIQGWIKERKGRKNQKFKDELVEEDFILEETIAIGVCEYHLNALEVYWINRYNSCDEGYNNNLGKYLTDDGFEEFNLILKENNLQFIDGELVKL